MSVRISVPTGKKDDDRLIDRNWPTCRICGGNHDTSQH